MAKNKNNIKTIPNIKEWEKSGLLEMIQSNKRKQLVAIALNTAGNYFLELYSKGSEDSESATFPTIVRIFRETKKDFTSDELIEVIMDIVDDFGKKYDKEKLDFDKQIITESVNDSYMLNYDGEAEFVRKYANNYIKKLNDNRKLKNINYEC